jgi:alpha-tubulin suppressor-like RCC1 family protein
VFATATAAPSSASSSHELHDVFVCGANSNGELGLGDAPTPPAGNGGGEKKSAARGDADAGGGGGGVTTAVPTPVPLPSLSSRALGGPHRRVTQVSAGYFFVAALCAAGEVYSWGGNDYGELGHGDVKCRKTPTAIAAFGGGGGAVVGMYKSKLADP